MVSRLRTALLAAVSCVGIGTMVPAAKADLVTYDIGWTGSGGYSMTGEFSFDDASGGDGRIDGTELLSLLIEAFQGVVSIGSWNLADGQGAGAVTFNFNFNPVGGTFFTGGLSFGPNGQQWNGAANPGLGFGSGSTLQGLLLNGVDVGAIPSSQSTLTATLRETVVVPEPTTIALFGAGLVGLGLMARKKKTT